MYLEVERIRNGDESVNAVAPEASRLADATEKRILDNWVSNRSCLDDVEMSLFAGKRQMYSLRRLSDGQRGW